MTTIQSLIDAVGIDRVNQQAEHCRLYSEDISGPAPHSVIAVVQPIDSDMVSTVLRWAFNNKVAVLIRGGGMSYTSGYLPERAGAIMLDMTAMQSIVAAQDANQSVIVEAGCTWASLYETLNKEHRRTPFFGPLSGQVATIGGAVAQNSAFFGSARYGTVRDHILGIELVDGQGQLHWIGEDECGQMHDPLAMGSSWRDMLIGDAGVFGVKTRLLLKTIQQPIETRFYSYVFDQAQQVVQCMSALGEVSQLADVFAFDRQTHMNLSQSGFSVLETPQLAQDLRRQSGSVLKAIGTLVQGATLSKVRLSDCAWSLHLTMELNPDEQSSPLDDRVAQICSLAGGSAIPDTIPRVTRARPFRSIRALVGPDGERWLPCHGVFSADAALVAMQKLGTWQSERSAELQRHNIRVSTLLARVGKEVIVEPQFFWPDSLSEFQRVYARPEQIKKFENNVEQPVARERVHELRAELRDIFIAEGARFMQLGKYYPWTHKLGAISQAQAQQLKQQLDPGGILNPGALRFQ